MRDPGTPGRNPFFDHGPEAFDDPAWAGADAGLPGPDERWEADEFPSGPDYWAPPGSDPLGTLAGLVDALQQVQPEATEHLVAAAHELMLAVKCVVDATEAVLAAQRADTRRDESVRASDGPEATAPTDEPAAPRSTGVRRIDLA